MPFCKAMQKNRKYPINASASYLVRSEKKRSTTLNSFSHFDSDGRKKRKKKKKT